MITIKDFWGMEVQFKNINELIEAFKEIIQPANEKEYESPILIHKYKEVSHTLHSLNVRIEEFPDILAYPGSLNNFAYNQIRIAIQKKRGEQGTVTWDERRTFIQELTFKKNTLGITYNKDVSELMQMISTRNEEFDNMPIDEQLQTLNNVIENLTQKENGKYKSIPEEYFFGYITEKNIIVYRKETHIFRHGSQSAIRERKEMKKDKKEFLRNLGLTIAMQLFNEISSNQEI